MAKKAVTGGLDYEYSASGGRKYNELPAAKARRPADYLSISALNDGLAPDEIHPDIDEIIAKTWR
jgi:hypothetical protein